KRSSCLRPEADRKAYFRTVVPTGSRGFGQAGGRSWTRTSRDVDQGLIMSASRSAKGPAGNPPRRDPISEQRYEKGHNEGHCTPENAVDPAIALLGESADARVGGALDLAEASAELGRLDEPTGVDQKSVHLAHRRPELPKPRCVLR